MGELISRQTMEMTKNLLNDGQLFALCPLCVETVGNVARRFNSVVEASHSSGAIVFNATDSYMASHRSASFTKVVANAVAFKQFNSAFKCASNCFRFVSIATHFRLLTGCLSSMAIVFKRKHLHAFVSNELIRHENFRLFFSPFIRRCRTHAHTHMHKRTNE